MLYAGEEVVKSRLERPASPGAKKSHGEMLKIQPRFREIRGKVRKTGTLTAHT